MSLGRTGPLVPVDDATIHVAAAEIEIDEPGIFPGQLATVPVVGVTPAPASPARLAVGTVRGRLLGAILTRLSGWLGDWTAYEVRREYLSRLELAAYQHRKELARAEKAAREHEARADAMTLEVEFLQALHARTMERVTSETLAYGAAGKALTQRSEE